jgi:hypothetical protein
MSTSSVDIPTMTDTNGIKQWYLNGERHRENGPAIEYENGIKVWYLNGEIHREDGPATEAPAFDHKEWYLNGVQLTEEDHSSQTTLVKSATH